jgi:preprotein translocase subunit SecA
LRPAWKAYEPILNQINLRRDELRGASDEGLKSISLSLRDQTHQDASAQEFLVESFAVACEASLRVLGLRPFDVQVLGALVLNDGKIAEMQTGEGKTLAAVMAVYAQAQSGNGVHVLTANDYLAKRDAGWMGGIYRFLGLSVGYLAQEMGPVERRQAYACDVTYATPNEVGFDYLRDHLALDPGDLVQRPFYSAVIDEVDSILIDEARIPLVIAGGDSTTQYWARRMARLAGSLNPQTDYFLNEYARNVQLTDSGAAKVEDALRCGSLYDLRNLRVLTAIHDALHALVLLRRDVDYLVKNGGIELVDEFKGRIAQNRRWPAGLQTALEAKEELPLKKQGRILGSITLQNLVALYPRVCGMTGTAATQVAEFREVYTLDVVEIPTNRPMIRVDHPDSIFPSRARKEQALIKEISSVHATGRPILVGTASVAESERLSSLISQSGVPHQVLNARNDEAEARIIAQAGAVGAVTISTNMAGRGTDILLGGNPPREIEKVVALGGLYVIGTNKHESRRIDNQLKGRAGRQGDPGSSRFFISLEDDLLVRYGIVEMLPPHLVDAPDQAIGDPAVGQGLARVQRIIEGQDLEIRRTLWKYEGIIEKQRQVLHQKRREVLLDQQPDLLETIDPERHADLCQRFGSRQIREMERRVALPKIDELWSDYLASIADLRDGIHWVSLGALDPLQEFIRSAAKLFDELYQELNDYVLEVFSDARLDAEGDLLNSLPPLDRGATWTYLVNDQPFGNLSDRIAAGLGRKLKMLRLFG